MTGHLTFAALAESETAQRADIRDEGDRAAHLAELEREIAVDQFHRYDPPADPQKEARDGTIICMDCDAPIHPGRLSAIRGAARCADCQRDEERRIRGVERTGGR
jgi:RNA polymerase-binding transcription factor DksA